MMPLCPICGKEMIVKPWNLIFDRVDCYADKISKYWHKEKQRFATDKEINTAAEEFNE